MLNTRWLGSPGPPSGSEVTWNNHRWVRFRTFMALLEKELIVEQIFETIDRIRRERRLTILLVE
jgi:hypothetical protein